MKRSIFSTILLLCIFTIGATPNFNEAPNGPGMMGVWGRPDKQGFLATLKQPVTATIAEGILSEVYYPSLDRAQTRDTQLIFIVDNTILEERKDFVHTVTRYPHSLAYHVSSVSRRANIRIEKDILLDPTQPTVIVNYQLSINTPQPPRIYVLHNPATDNTAGGDAVAIIANAQEPGEILSYQSDRRGDEPAVFARRTVQILKMNRPAEDGAVGFEGVNAPWNQLNQYHALPYKYQSARNGNVSGALGFTPNTSQVQLTLALSFTAEQAGLNPTEVLRQLTHKNFNTPVSQLLALQQQEWSAYLAKLNSIGQKLEPHVLMIKGMEDKFFLGAIVAGPAKPSLPDQIELSEHDYESARLRTGDANGGYHRVWPRDLAQMALGLMAAGDYITATNIARYFVKTQKSDGTFWQNTWVNGDPSWRIFQIDQTGFPIILVGKLLEERAINYDEFRSMVVRAADALVKFGPYTGQDRWEEVAGLSPNSIAIATQGLYEAAWLEKERDPSRAQIYMNTANKWRDNVFQWTLVANGNLGRNYFERIHIGHPDNHNHATPLQIANGGQVYEENEIIDGGFLQWIISGLIAGQDPRFTSSLTIYDRMARAQAPGGLGYLRYNHDAYGTNQVGKAWPLLSGERALAAIMRGEDPMPHVNVLVESINPATGVMCEQTGVSVCPLGWAHAEALLVARSLADKRSYYIPKRIKTGRAQ
ncbi:MAG: glycoside hydrolase family 15 protein [Oligoflexia bacterium]|nr:glycoside hydrolase family 15 protein [Oligoflexia bacterium]